MAAGKDKKIDDLMEKASEALVRTRYFEAERLCEKALLMARQNQDFEQMARIVLPLQEARRQRFQQAIDVGKIRLIDKPVAEDVKVERGCYLVQPPQVGADGRRLRMASLQQEKPVAVLCREPTTALKQVPIVAIGTGTTIRTRIEPPKNPSKPDMAWLVAAFEQLGDAALESLDPSLPGPRKVDALLDRLDALPEHEKLHQALAEACRTAAKDATLHDEVVAGKLAAKVAAKEAAAKSPRKTGVGM
jgi:hypothetical protein